jgi:membrane protein
MYVRKRLLSFGMLLTILFMLLVSMVVSAVIHGFLQVVGSSSGYVALAANSVISLALFTLLFAMLFKYVPDARLNWRPVWSGAIVASVLFMIGKYVLGLYLGRGGYESSYGAAVGSFVALLVWVYYSSTILLIGGEATQVWARRHGERIRPEDHAVRVVQETRTADAGKDAKPDR